MNYSQPTLRRALAAEYALGTMAPAARRRFEQLMQDDRALRGEVAQWQEVLSSLGTALPVKQPPERVWKAILARIQPHTAKSPRPLWHWLVGGLATLSLVISVVFTLQPPAAPAYLAALQNDATVTALTITARGNELEVRPLAAAPIASNQSLELWIVPTAGKAISLGVVPAQGNKRIKLTPAQQREIGESTLLAITLEPLGGSPTGVATGPIVYKGYLKTVRS